MVANDHESAFDAKAKWKCEPIEPGNNGKMPIDTMFTGEISSTWLLDPRFGKPHRHIKAANNWWGIWWDWRWSEGVAGSVGRNLFFGYGPKTTCTGNLLPYSRLWSSLELYDINSLVDSSGHFEVSMKWFYRQAHKVIDTILSTSMCNQPAGKQTSPLTSR